jgi:GT2 family glycosyltransferase
MSIPKGGNDNISVAAVIVTHNRKRLLCECIDAARAQSSAAARIVVTPFTPSSNLRN